jgi:alkylation response protein AidB-like acyl-CoA dehydrogenase
VYSPGVADHVLTSLLRNVGQLEPLVRAHAAEADAQARLPDPVVQALIEAGLFRLWIPKSCGGFELSLVGALKVYEAAAALDGSVGWAVMIGSGGGLFAAYLLPDVAREMFAAPNSVIAGSGAPLGRAERVRDGYVVSGRWPYASGAHYATTFTANCVLVEDGEELQADDGTPLVRAMSFDPSQVEILPTWDSVGMRGTGSHDFAVNEAFVPEQCTFSVNDAPHEPGTLYRVPFTVLTELPITAVAVGIARHALDTFAKLAHTKKRYGSDVTLDQDPVVQLQYARTYARWCAEQASLYASAASIWHVAVLGRSPREEELAEVTARCTVGVSELQRLVSDLASLAGMNAVAAGDEFARAVRDLQTLAAHASVSPANLARAGGALLQGGNKPSDS